MSDIVLTLGWGSFFLAVASYIFGAAGIIRGPAHPSIISRFFWLTLSITNILSYWSLGAGSGMFLALANTIGSTTIFLLSLRFGYIEFKRSDIITVIGAGVALLCYLLIDMKLVALAAGLLTHFISGIPTYKKVMKSPESEDLSFWLLFAIASGCSLLGVILQDKNIVYPIYFLLFDAGMTALICIQRYRLNTVSKKIKNHLSLENSSQ
jgi:hypothetical protein